MSVSFTLLPPNLLIASRPGYGRAAPARASRLVVRAAGEKWARMQQTLKEANIQSVEVTQVVGLQQSGYTLVDVRPGEDFEESHISGSVSVPLFGPIQISSPAKLLKSLMYAANGMKGTDENPRFVDEVRGRAGGLTDGPYLGAAHTRGAWSPAQGVHEHHDN